MNKAEQLASLVRNAKHMVVLTGAGMSTESGIPDFRSSEGLWKKYDPFTVSHVDTIDNDYDAFHSFYGQRIAQQLQNISPNEGHNILARWEAAGIVKFLATQNVENLHQRAGSKNVAQLHGGLDHIYCHHCGTPSTLEAFLEKKPCSSCGGRLRPNIVLFGEMLPQDVWSQAFTEIARSDLLLIIGTSLRVSPVNQLPLEARGKIAIINMDETPFDEKFDLVIREKAAEVLREVESLL
ncbi:NAD-dependent deacylase [Ectobacillus funiculus]|uniref:SIR2 family NAD-dependent protein deacylase n=1 Tax=Ectobacillus funiculus TaxID=137993 RepID=UPI003978AC60